VTRHGPNHACAAATVLQRSADLVSCGSALAVGHHPNTPSRETAHRHRNEVSGRTCRGDRRNASCISRKPKSP
jgi:hypothetical protein